jgi:tetratricopeptide (TPR) repeat protein
MPDWLKFERNDRKLSVSFTGSQHSGPNFTNQPRVIGPVYHIEGQVVMRAKILWRWAILIAVVGLIVGSGFLIQQFQISRLARSVADRADTAVEEGDYSKAETLYREQLQVFPDDTEIKIKYADTLLKAASSPKRQERAQQIYTEILRASPGRDDVRRRRMELSVLMGRLRDQGAEADLKILLRTPDKNPDGHLLYLMGLCSEDGKNDSTAKVWFEQAINRDAPEKVDAYQRLATMLRSPDRLNDPKAADRVIDQMVTASPENYRVYLVRGRYRRQFDLPGSKADFEKSLKLADNQPETFLEMARIAETESGQPEAKKILEAGLKKVPAAAELYVRLADLEQRSGHSDQAVATLENGLKSTAEKGAVRWLLANILALRGDTGRLLLEIEEMKSIGISQILLDFLTAHYYVNSSEFRKAKQLLVTLESVSGLRGDLKARVNNLLARCYSQLGEQGKQQEALLRALSANPQDVQAKLGLIERMVKQGEIDEAIKEYRTLARTVPKFGIFLAQQLIAWNLRRPAAQRDWNETETLIDYAAKTFPDDVEPVIVRAEMAVAREQGKQARDQLQKARIRFPKSVVIRCALANFMATQKQFDEARTLLEETQKELGDSVELRLQRARLFAVKGGPQVVAGLNDLSQNIEPFSKAERRKLLTGLALEFVRLQDPQGASRLWSRLAEQEPNDLDLRLNLLDLAFQTGKSEEIDQTIKQIERIEGNDGSLGPICQVQYLIWQAERAVEKEPQEARRLRNRARILLNDLVARRADWSAIPVALAHLEEQELRQERQEKSQGREGGLSDREIQAKEESIVRSYRRAIDLGQRSSAIVRETVKLLFKLKRGSEAIDLINSIPIAPQLASDLGRQALSFAVENRDFERAEEIARKALAAKPADFQERIWLVQILLNRGRQAEAESVIREGLELSKNEPDRWVVLVQFLAQTKQPAKAAKAIKDAEAQLPESQAPLALAQCCTLLGRSYESSDEDQKKQWYAQAKRWYEKSLAAHPDDLSIARRVTDFFVQTRQMAEVEAHLEAIRNRGSNAQSAEIVAWANRTLARALASSPEPEKVRRALSILTPTSQAAASGPGAKAIPDPEDLRALAFVLNAQRNVADRKRAIEIVESLVIKNLASPDDRFFLARLHETSGNWPKALDIYRDLILRTKNPRDLESLNRRSLYLTQFAQSLLRNHKESNEQELTEAQELVDELALRQPDALETLILQVDVCQARKRVDKAVELVQATSHRPNLSPVGVKTLAMLAEKLDRNEIAKQLYERYADLPSAQDGKMTLALYLSRQGRIKDALDICEPFWKQPRDVEALASACVQVVAASNEPLDRVQIDRISRWLEQALVQKKESTFLIVSLANFREQQKRYDDAKALYQSVIKKDPGIKNEPGGSAAPSIATNVLAMSYNNLAWLMALKDGQGKDALEDINRAIKLVGPQPDFLDTRGVIHLGLNETLPAIRDLETAVKAAPSPSKMFHLAQAYYQNKETEKAKLLLKEAKAKGLDRIRVGPGALHSLEQPAYRKLQSELGLSDESERSAVTSRGP